MKSERAMQCFIPFDWANWNRASFGEMHIGPRPAFRFKRIDRQRNFIAGAAGRKAMGIGSMSFESVFGEASRASGPTAGMIFSTQSKAPRRAWNQHFAGRFLARTNSREERSHGKREEFEGAVS
ncbi:hypothetical protein JJC00_01905 [Bradyrhizobium diazoefficiens]|uniref:hypothetical protein n=1 Tax=Bradyrhizobium diazoefficiens TaxID=1355477 RepID=UPI0019093AFB|nr:hypothetical protein [Bradyrhizobium diazoefficiens]QQO34486.1 hypothetical protein JJC00_01905 [Bradyrhizobium diazoefficiens]